jgi:hypothetical protein
MRGLLCTVAVSKLLVLTGCGAETARDAGAVQPATGVCRDVEQCQVVAETDVDGDGVRDQVGFVSESEHRVVVHVKTAGGQRMRHGMDITWFPRGEFYGAAPIDGRPGAELVVGSMMGAHTLFFTTLAVQTGRIVQLPAPGGEPEWMIDGAYSFHAGVSRRVEDGRVVVVLRDAARDGVRSRFTGRDRTYVWAHGGWRHRSTTRTRYDGERTVAKVGGWDVPGLPRFPHLAAPQV